MKMSRTMTNLQIAKLLRAVAAALSLSKDDNRFRVIAYERAADAVEHSSSEVKDLWDDGKVGELAGIGENLAAHLDELFRTGRVRHFQSIFKPFPPALFELLEIPGIGPKSALKLTKSLGITKTHSAVSELEKAAKHGHIREIEGFGQDSEAEILRGIEEYRGRTRRMLLPVAQEIADSLIAWMYKDPHVKRADPLGSLRRQAATIGDVDISVASDNPVVTIQHFCNYPKKSRVLEAGDKTASLILPNEYQVDLMVQPLEAYGSLLQHFTGSKHHNVALREYALKKGFSLSEYGIRHLPPPSLGGGTKGGGITTFSNEKSFYEYLGLDWIPPEMREDNGELEAAKTHTLPDLVELKDIRGDLQLHSNIDIEPSHDLGASSVAEMAAAAHALGYEYLGLTEHNPSLSRHTSTQILDIVKRKTAVINKFNNGEKSHEKRIPFVFNGLEIDLQPDGRRALPDAALELLDYACVSLHSSFRMSRRDQTARVLRGLDHPKVRFFAHPTGRLLGEREGVELDWDAIFDFCLKNHKWLEVDAWPNRLDLPDSLVHEAVKRGVKLIIDTDSHAADQMVYMRYGVSVARRGWAASADIMNTLSLTQFKKLIKGGE
jgi:DNA polymerase (family X)